MLSILGLAATFLGVKEIPGAKSNPIIGRMLQAVGFRRGSDETPWCAAYVNWVLESSGYPGTGSARARSFEDWGKQGGAWPGHVAVLWRKRRNGRSGHVAFVLRVSGDRVLLLGGNQGNRVSAKWYPLSRVVCFRRA